MRGDPSILDAPSLSIIGARKSTPYGRAIAEMAGRIAAESGIVVVSGGARGCDQAGGMGALNAGGGMSWFWVRVQTSCIRRVPAD